jgi:hypothetical protein
MVSITKIITAGFEKITILFGGPFERTVFFELECSHSLGSGLLWILLNAEYE